MHVICASGEGVWGLRVWGGWARPCGGLVGGFVGVGGWGVQTVVFDADSASIQQYRLLAFP